MRREIRITRQINPARLLEELEQLAERHPALRVDGVWQAALNVYEDGYALEVPAESDVDEAALDALLDAHDPAALSTGEIKARRREAAGQTARRIPGWATWTEQQVIDYINGNVTDLASAKTVLVAMARLLVALRNHEWPDLEGSA